MPSENLAIAAVSRTPTPDAFNPRVTCATLIAVIPQRSKAIDMRREQAPHEDEASETENTSRRFQPSADLFKRVIRRPELRKIVPLADTTIYEMEQRGEFPKRFFLTPRCVVWNLAEVETWLDERRRASETDALRKAPGPDVRQRRTRPVKPPIQLG